MAVLRNGSVFFTIGGKVIEDSGAAVAPPVSSFDPATMANIYWYVDANSRAAWSLSGNYIENFVDISPSGFQIPAQSEYNAAIGAGGGNPGFDVDGTYIKNNGLFNRHIFQDATFDHTAAGTEVDKPIANTTGPFTYFLRIFHPDFSDGVIDIGDNSGLAFRITEAGVELWRTGLVRATATFSKAINTTDEHIYVIRRDGSDVISVRKGSDTARNGVFTWEDGVGTTVQNHDLYYGGGFRLKLNASLRAAGVVDRYVDGSELSDLESYLEGLT